MAINFYVPSGKVLYIPTGGYRFVGPCQVNLSGKVKMPDTFEDGTPTIEADHDIEERTGSLPEPSPVISEPEVENEPEAAEKAAEEAAESDYSTIADIADHTEDPLSDSD